MRGPPTDLQPPTPGFGFEWGRREPTAPLPEMSQCQDSGGPRACSGRDQASLHLPLPFSAHSLIVSPEGKLPRLRPGKETGWLPHPQAIPSLELDESQPASALIRKGQGLQIKTGWSNDQDQRGHTKVWQRAARKPECQEEVCSFPCFPVGSAVRLSLTFSSRFLFHKGGKQSGMAGGRLGGFILVEQGRISFSHRKYRTVRGKRKREEGRLIWLCMRVCCFLHPLIEGINKDGSDSVERGAGSRGGGGPGDPGASFLSLLSGLSSWREGRA